jgi:hypothetical protein
VNGTHWQDSATTPMRGLARSSVPDLERNRSRPLHAYWLAGLVEVLRATLIVMCVKHHAPACIAVIVPCRLAGLVEERNLGLIAAFVERKPIAGNAIPVPCWLAGLVEVGALELVTACVEC